MRYKELISENNKLPIDNIIYILQSTDNDKIFSFIEKAVGESMQQEAVSRKDDRIAAIEQALQASDDPKLMNYIESVVKKIEISERVDKLWNTRGFSSGRMSKYKSSFFNVLLNSSSSLKSKIQLLYLLTKNTQGIEASSFSKSFRQSIYDIVPSVFRNNETFDAIKEHIFSGDTFRGKGIGQGEFGIALLGKNGNIVDAGGDVVVDGWGIEIKSGKGGSIKTGEPTSHRPADKLRDWIGKEFGVHLDRKNKLKWDRDSEFISAFNAADTKKKLNVLTKYFDEMYPSMSSSYKTTLIKSVIQYAGTKEVHVPFAKVMLDVYKEHDNWDSLLLIHDNGMAVNVADDSGIQYLRVVIQSNRDGDSQAVPDGFINIGIKK